MARALGLALFLLAPLSAAADALPACPEGEHLETNPVPPGAMHHAGGRCVDDADDCSVAGSGTLAAAMLVALVLVRRSRKRTRALGRSGFLV